MGICVCRICPKKSLKVKSTVALYLKIHFMRHTNHVQNVMLYQKMHNSLLCSSTISKEVDLLLVNSFSFSTGIIKYDST